MTEIKSFETWCNDFTTKLIMEVMKHAEEHTKQLPPSASHAVYNMCISKLIGSVLYRTLKEKPTLNFTKQQLVEFALKNFADMKGQVQESVAFGFQDAMEAFSGKEVEYYCQVKIVPPPVTRKLC